MVELIIIISNNLIIILNIKFKTAYINRFKASFE